MSSNIKKKKSKTKSTKNRIELNKFLNDTTSLLSWVMLVISIITIVLAWQTLNETKRQRELFEKNQSEFKTEELASFILDLSIELVNLNECLKGVKTSSEECISKDGKWGTIDDGCLLLIYFEELVHNDSINKLIIRHPGNFDYMHRDIRWVYRRVRELKETAKDINAIVYKIIYKEINDELAENLIRQHQQNINKIYYLLTPHVESLINKLKTAGLIDPKIDKLTVYPLTY